MRYYCEVCKCIIEFGVVKDLSVITEKRCCLCGKHRDKQSIVPIPDYETPEQYEKRTGQKLSKDAAVWFIRKDGKPFYDGGMWGICRYQTTIMDRDQIIIVVQSPEPPPYNWRPQ